MKKLCAVVLLAGILLLITSCKAEQDSTSITIAMEPSVNATSVYGFAYPGIVPAIATVPVDPYLIYVSRDYALPAIFIPALQVCIATYPEKIEMEATAATQYKVMYDAALAEGAEIVPYSGYRSISHQKDIFDYQISTFVSKGYPQAEAVNLAALSILPPGCSEHNTGLAIDITCPGVWDTSEDFKATKEFAWLQAHAHEYGFILRYPDDKQDITDVMFEPWHWRYVGAEPATIMKESGYCLEEHLGITS